MATNLTLLSMQRLQCGLDINSQFCPAPPPNDRVAQVEKSASKSKLLEIIERFNSGHSGLWIDYTLLNKQIRSRLFFESELNLASDNKYGLFIYVEYWKSFRDLFTLLGS